MTTTSGGNEIPNRVGAITRAVALDMLHELYDEIPAVACKGLCHDSCTQVSASQLERDQLTPQGITLTDRSSQWWMAERARTGIPLPACPALTADHRCQVYADRPFVCRAFGIVSASGLTGPDRFQQPMMCDHGCEPADTITLRTFAEWLCRIEVLSRIVTGVARSPVPGDSPALLAALAREMSAGVSVAARDIFAARSDAARRARARRRKPISRRT